MKHPWRIAIVGLPVLVTAAAGCYVPDYHTPKGFSSTFHRRLFDSERYAASQPAVPVSVSPVTPVSPELTAGGVEELPAP